MKPEKYARARDDADGDINDIVFVDNSIFDR